MMILNRMMIVRRPGSNNDYLLFFKRFGMSSIDRLIESIGEK